MLLDFLMRMVIFLNVFSIKNSSSATALVFFLFQSIVVKKLLVSNRAGLCFFTNLTENLRPVLLPGTQPAKQAHLI
jgi:hypothetical protein